MTGNSATSMPTAMSSAANLRDFLEWLDAHPRTYAETMDAWRTHCPRLTIWEDAVDNGFVALEARQGISRNDEPVVLTASGRAWLRSTISEGSGSFR